ncbi:hypothetical protein HYY75_10375 [bacterium]|nr:hypothetical protein [bacterium]
MNFPFFVANRSEKIPALSPKRTEKAADFHIPMGLLKNYFPKTIAIKVAAGFMPAKPGFSQTKVCGYQGRFRVILQEPPSETVFLPLKIFKRNPKLSRHGSVLLIVAGVLFCLALFGGGFFKYMLLQNRQSHRQGEQQITGAFALALASLAAHKIQESVFRNPNHSLTAYLASPISSMDDFCKGTIDFAEGEPETDISPVVSLLSSNQVGLGQVSFEVKYVCRRIDFFKTSLSDKFPREKQGLIHLIVTTAYKKFNDSSSETVEEFHYGSRVKVTSALFPVLSKFTLYVENSGEGSALPAPWRFNVVSTDPSGNLTPNSRAKPILLKNGIKDPNIPPSIFELVKSPRGLVYFGGGKTYLNLARGWPQTSTGGFGEYGEGFHLYGMGRKDCFYTAWKEDGGTIAILNFDQGTCDETLANSDYLEAIGESPWAKFARCNSAFRLFGTDQEIYPTLVLGEVYRSSIRVRAYKTISVSPVSYGILKHMPHGNSSLALQEWSDYINPPADSESPGIQYFANKLGLSGVSSSRDMFNQTYASDMGYTPYNSSLAFMETQNREAFPINAFSPSDPLNKFISADPLPVSDPNDILHAIPEPFQIIPGVTSLINMASFFGALGIPGDRTSWVIDASAEGISNWSGLLVGLRKRGLLKGSNLLDLNGWLYIKGNVPLEINQNLLLVSNGGIVLQKGNVKINRSIGSNAPSKNYALQIVAADGDIEVCGNITVSSALVAKGTVRFNPSGRPTIKGAIAMGRFEILSASQGAVLDYNSKLAALPCDQNPSEELSEKPILCFSMDPSLFSLP